MKSFLGMWSKDGKREETGKGEMSKLLPKELSFIKCFYGPGTKQTGFSFEPDSILKEEYCLLVYYLVPPSLLECKLWAVRVVCFAHHCAPTLDRFIDRGAR